MILRSLFVLVSAALGAAAMAQVGVDGQYGSEWSGVTAYHVTHTDAGPYGSFTTGVSYNTEGAGYDVYFRSDSNYIYGLLTATDHIAGAQTFANAYFNVDGYADPNEGSNFGMEITNNRAFIPGGNGAYFDLTGYLTQVEINDGTHLSLEFALNLSFLTTDPEHMGFNTTQAGDRITFRTSQSFGYAVAGYDINDPHGFGTPPSYTDADRLGFTTYSPGLSTVPGPPALAVFGLGFFRKVRRRRAPM